MVLFRHHRGSLDDSLKTCEKYVSEDDMKEAISAYHNRLCCDMSGYRPVTKDDVVVEDRWTDDPRCGWGRTRYVCLKWSGNVGFEHPQCIGMCCDMDYVYDPDGEDEIDHGHL